MRHGQVIVIVTLSPRLSFDSVIAWLERDFAVAPEEAVGKPLGLSFERAGPTAEDRRREEEPARLLLVLDEVGDLAAQEVAEAQAGQQHADHAGPAVDARAQVALNQAAGDHFERHEDQAGDKGQDRQVAQARPRAAGLGLAGGRLAGGFRQNLIAAPGASSRLAPRIARTHAATLPAIAT